MLQNPCRKEHVTNCIGHLKHKDIQVTKLMTKEKNHINQEFEKGT